MKKRKILSLILSMVMATTGLFTVAGCSKLTGGKGAVKKKVVTIEENTPWFNSTRCVVEKDYAKEYGLEYCYSYGDPFFCDEGVLIYYDGFNIDTWEENDYMTKEDSEIAAHALELQFGRLDCYDLEGNVVWSVDTSSTFASNEPGKYSYVNGIVKKDNECYIRVEKYDDSTFTSESLYYKVDTSNGNIDETPVKDDGLGDIPDIGDSNTSYERTFSQGKTAVHTFYGWNETGDPFYKFAIVDASGKTTVVDSRDFLTGLAVYDVSGGAFLSDTEVIMFASTSSSVGMLSLDLEKKELSVYDAPEGLEGINSYDLVELDNEFYVRNTEGISKVDFINGTKEEIFSFSDCNINLFEVNNLSIGKITDDEILLSGQVWDQYGSGSKQVIYSITKADSNPNAGKILLSASNLSWLDESTAAAIYEFNNTNEKYFISYDENYTVDYNQIDFSASEEDYNAQIMDQEVELSKQLAMDLMNGEGPDILLNAASMQELNNPDYLVDLSDYIKDMSNEDYFMNIVDAAKQDDKLYQLPLTFYIEALYGPSGLGESGVGFTFDEYDTIVDEHCNGNDPLNLNYGRLDVFRTLIANIGTPIVDSKGKVNLNSDEFKAICEYCAQYPEKSYYDDNEEFMGSVSYYGPGGGSMDYDSGDIQLMYVGSSYTILNSVLSDKDNANKSFYGYPSFDGKGPSATIDGSVAIAASCANSDGAWEFIETLLDDECLGKSYSLTISRAAFENSIISGVEEFNKSIDDNKRWMSEAEMQMYGLPTEYANIDDLDTVIAAFESINSVDGIDTEMLQIISEEIQPYFAEQKSLEDVLLIMEDKCQTVVDERA